MLRISFLKHGFLFLICLCLGTGMIWAQEESESSESSSAMEEMIVTAQRVEENIQDVPISVTALDEIALELQQVITPSDLQMSVPNLSFTSQNFGGFSFSIRGIGSLITGSAAEAGVAAHLNEIPLRSNMNIQEFFDIERVEVLRGPQGTLFGRNATGGSINIVTGKPSFSDIDGYLKTELGTFAHTRFAGMLNVPLTSNVAARLAFMSLKRDGFTENLAAESDLLDVASDYDGRNQWALRVTVSVNINANANAWFLFSQLSEDSNRARITNQICERGDLPTNGCKANGFGFDSPHLGSTIPGIFGAGLGVWYPGTSGVTGTVQYDVPRPQLDLRSVHTDFDPVFQEDETFLAMGIDFDWNDFKFEVLSAFTERSGVSLQDYLMDVGPVMPPTPYNPQGYWPVSRTSGNTGEDFASGGCNFFAGTAGVLGGCINTDLDTNRLLMYDQSDGNGNYWVIEGRVHAIIDEQISYMLGSSIFGTERGTNYYIFSNVFDAIAVTGAPLLNTPPLYPSFFGNSSTPNGGFGRTNDGVAVFGEAYYQIDDRTELTFGLRYNEDQKWISDTSILFDATNQVPLLHASVYPAIRAYVASVLGVPVELVPLQTAIQGAIAAGLLDANHLTNINAVTGVFWTRAMNLLLGPFAVGAPEIGLAAYHGATRAEIEAAMLTPAYSAERVALIKKIPIIADFSEARGVTGSPDDGEWTALTGRITLDHQLNDDIFVYGTLSTGYKPGGLNAAIPVAFQNVSTFTFDREEVTSFELGTKSLLMDRRVVFNGAFFAYQYSGLQVTRIKNNASINENIDANAWGLEAEGTFQLDGMPQVVFDYGYSFLNTAVDGTASLDPLNRTAGNSDWVLLKNIDPGTTTGVNFVARKAQLTQQVIDAALAAGATIDIRNRTTPYSLSYPANEFGVSVPAYFSRLFLNTIGVETSEGVLTELDGNSLPHSPEHTLNIGATYNFPISTGFFDGDVSLRGSLYWQSESFSREFNTPGDEIDAWSQINLSATYTSSDGRLMLSGWVRNVQDNDNVTGMYLTSDTSGFFRNYFMTEPQVAGLTLRYSM